MIWGQKGITRGHLINGQPVFIRTLDLYSLVQQNMIMRMIKVMMITLLKGLMVLTILVVSSPRCHGGL